MLDIRKLAALIAAAALAMPHPIAAEVTGTNEAITISAESVTRVLVEAHDASVLDGEPVISNFGDAYLLEYGSGAEAEAAAARLAPVTEAADIDAVFTMADEMIIDDWEEPVIIDSTAGSTEGTEGNNGDTDSGVFYGSDEGSKQESLIPVYAPIQEPEGACDIAEEQEPEPIQGMAGIGNEMENAAGDSSDPLSVLSGLVDDDTFSMAASARPDVALVDAGGTLGGNIIQCVSLVGDVTADETKIKHGVLMAHSIVNQNPSVTIVSIRVMDADGQATASSVYAGIQYARELGVKVINLSMGSNTGRKIEAIENAIDGAVSEGIIVVGAAGNDGADTAGYVPGNVESCIVCGSADAFGIRNAGSNYGSTVDWNVVATSTSQACAKMSGFLSRSTVTQANYTSAIQSSLNKGLIYETGYKIDISKASFDTKASSSGGNPGVTLTASSYDGTMECVLTEGTDYTLSISQNGTTGTYHIKAAGIGKCTGILEYDWDNGTKIPVRKCSISGVSSQAYKGTAATLPGLTVSYNGASLKEGTDYTVSYRNNTSPGTAYVTITGKGKFTGTVTKTFTITASAKTDIDACTITGIMAKRYTGYTQKQASLAVRYNGRTLTEGTDYSVSYRDNINKGTATLTVTGKGSFTGSTTRTFTITAKPIAGAFFYGVAAAYLRTGSSICPSPRIRTASGTLALGTDYTVEYGANRNGYGTVKVTGRGNYSGSITKVFKIA